MVKFITVVISITIFSILYPQAYDMPYKNNDGSPVIVIIMVENEVDVIISKLQSFAQEGITKFLVFDTGSTDGTQDKVREYFNQCSFKHAYIIEEAFIDFETSHNRALNLGEQIFPNETLLLAPRKGPYIYLLPDSHPFCKHLYV